jgi:hypothetical protein
MPCARRIFYRYSNILLADDLEIDLTHELVLKQGDIISRCGRNWKIESVLSEEFSGHRLKMPTIFVYLVDASVN